MSKILFTLCVVLATIGWATSSRHIETSVRRIGATILKNDVDENRMEDQLYSPYAIGNMAGMMMMAADDHLKMDLMKLMMLNKTEDIAMMHMEFEQVMKSLKEHNDIIKQRNIIAIQNGIKVKSDFETHAKKHYPFVMEMQDLHGDQFIKDGNMKMSERTGGKLSKIFLRDNMKIAAETNMLMMSLAFTNKLEVDEMKSMKLAEKIKFHTIDNKEIEKDFIRIQGDLHAMVNDDKIIWVMKMKGNLSFIGIMPRKMDMNSFMKNFDYSKFKEELMMMKNGKKEMTDLKMPCIHIEKEYPLMDIMMKIGVKKEMMMKTNAWPMIADQLKMGQGSMHRTMLMVDVHNDQLPEKIDGAKQVLINRPFAFSVLDHSTNMPVMVGMMMM